MITPLLEHTAPELLGVYGVDIDTAAPLVVAAGDTPSACLLRQPGRTCAGSRLSRPHRASSPGTVSTVAGTAKPTGRCGTS